MMNTIPRAIKRAFPKVTKAIDAKHQISIHVNTRDCKNGTPLNPSECALAKAIKREFHADAAIVGLGASWIIKGNKATRFHTPERIRREIVSFDRSSDFAEGNYILTPKCKSLRLGADNRERDKKRRGRHDKSPKKVAKNVRVRIVNTKSLS